MRHSLAVKENKEFCDTPLLFLSRRIAVMIKDFVIFFCSFWMHNETEENTFKSNK